MVVAADEAERPTKKPRHSRSLPSIKSPLPSSSSFLPRTSSSHTLVPRCPQAGRSIAPNPLRPFVAAADRLSMWESPYSLAFKRDLYSSLPTHIADAALHTVNAAYAPNTMSSYAAGLLRFTQFCDEINIPEADRMPASFMLLVGFISFHAGAVSGSTIKGWMSGLKAWHDINHAPWNGLDRWVELARTSSKKSGAHHKRPQRPPVTLAHLRCLRESLDISTPAHAAYWAIACSAFWGCRRLGELTIRASSAFDPLYHILKSCNKSKKTRHGVIVSLSYHIPWTKSTKEEGGTLCLTAQPDYLDIYPVAAMTNHETVNRDVPGDAPLFAYASDNNNGWRMVLKQTFMTECSKI